MLTCRERDDERVQGPCSIGSVSNDDMDHSSVS